MKYATSLIPPAILAALGLLTAGCGSTKGYPTLARRPAERMESQPATAPRAVAYSPPAGLSTRLEALKEQARAAHAGFEAARPATAKAIDAASGTQPASENWSLATEALSKLQAARSGATSAMAELDRLYVQTKIDGGDGVAIAAVRSQVSAWVADEDAALAELETRMPQ